MNEGGRANRWRARRKVKVSSVRAARRGERKKDNEETKKKNGTSMRIVFGYFCRCCCWHGDTCKTAVKLGWAGFTLQFRARAYFGVTAVYVSGSPFPCLLLLLLFLSLLFDICLSSHLRHTPFILRTYMAVACLGIEKTSREESVNVLTLLHVPCKMKCFFFRGGPAFYGRGEGRTRV